MTEYVIAIVVGAIQIILSTCLIVRQKNGVAILSEILSSLILFFILNGLSIEINCIFLMRIILTLVEYLSVKISLVIFMIIARLHSFNVIKKLCRKNKKKKAKKLKLINAFRNVKYWPRLKLGLPAMVNKTHRKTKVKYDSKGFPKFKSYYTVKLRKKDYRKTREQHFYIANKTIYKEIVSNYKLRAKFSGQEIKDFSQGITPSRFTWHHHQDAGILQLVDCKVHSKTSHIGGYSIWGSK